MSVSYELLKEDKRVIAYRPRLSRMIGTTAAILLQQIIYWYNHEPFYKFKTRCHNEKYKEGDSWTEELGFSVAEFDTAIKRIGTKVKKGVKKSELIDGEFDIPQPLLTETKRQYTKRLHDVLNKLVIYWIDSNRVTWYHLNTDLLGKLIISIYLDKWDISIYLENAHAQFTFMQETTHKTTTKEKDIAAPTSGDGAIIGEVIHNCYGCGTDMFAGDKAYWATGNSDELFCYTCHLYEQQYYANMKILGQAVTVPIAGAAPIDDTIQWNDSVHDNTLADYIVGGYRCSICFDDISYVDRTHWMGHHSTDICRACHDDSHLI
jgi:hypothetical protein